MSVLSNIENFAIYLLRCLVYTDWREGFWEKKNIRNIIIWFSRVMVVMRYVHMINKRKRTCTQRELFYNLGNFFKSQSEIKVYLKFVSDVTGMPLYNLGINITDRGTIAGLIKFVMDGEQIDISKRPFGMNISSNLLGIDSRIEGNYILVVEKHSIFVQLCSQKIWEKFPLVMVTGNGFPSDNTRNFVEKISSNNKLEVSVAKISLQICYLGDYDPHGILIMLSYFSSTSKRRSCINSSNRFNNLKVDSTGLKELKIENEFPQESRYKWLGINSEDIGVYNVKNLMSLSPNELSVLKRLNLDPRICSNKQLKEEVEKNLGKKVEIEAVAECAKGGISQYVVDKIIRHEWISV